jgi:replicative DNA helicase
MALQVASDCRYPALFVSAEMGLLELFRRLIARSTQTFLGKLKSGEIAGANARNLALQTVEKLPHLAMMDATQAYAAPALIADVAEGLKEKMQAEHLLIVVDSLQVWAKSVRAIGGDVATASEYDVINSGLFAAAGIASRLACPVLMISHRNRVGNKEGGGLHSAKGSGDVEYCAESILDLSVKQDQQPDAMGETDVAVKVLKNRHGVPGISASLKFSGRLQEFREA